MYEKPLEIRHFPTFLYPEETELAPPRAAEHARGRRDEEDGYNGGRWV